VARILDNLETLKKIIRRKPFGLITDMDGTINEIPHDFLQKTLHPLVTPQLTNLAAQLELLAIVSGRKTEALREIINIEGVKYIGNYGMEWWENNRAVLHPDINTSLSAMRAVAQELDALRSVEGIIIQDKWATMSIHYHLCRQPEVAKQQILDLLYKSPHINNLRLMDEKTNIGIVPRVDINKGTAVTSLIKEYHLQSAIYLGDDIGDVPAFKAVRQAREKETFDGLAILVTGPETSQEILGEADFTLNDVQETEQLLNWLIDNTPARKLRT
jgi:trehalose 6-phosphate phosphatase